MGREKGGLLERGPKGGLEPCPNGSSQVEASWSGYLLSLVPQRTMIIFITDFTRSREFQYCGGDVAFVIT